MGWMALLPAEAVAILVALRGVCEWAVGRAFAMPMRGTVQLMLAATTYLYSAAGAAKLQPAHAVHTLSQPKLC